MTSCTLFVSAHVQGMNLAETVAASRLNGVCLLYNSHAACSSSTYMTDLGEGLATTGA